MGILRLKILRWLAVLSVLGAMTVAGCRFSKGDANNVETVKFTPEEQTSAIASVRSFLSELDKEGGATWEQLSDGTRASTPELSWALAVKAFDAACGPIISRGNAHIACTEKLPDAPPGRYFIFDIESKFEKINLIERVVLVREHERWAIAGYFRRRTFYLGAHANSS